MKIVFSLLLLMVTGSIYSQQKSKPKEKAPTQKELEASRKKAQSMMDEMMKEMSDEDRKMMDSLGIKMPDLKNLKTPKVTNQQLADAWEDENRLTPKRDDARIASIPKVAAARFPAYLAAVQKKVSAQLDSKTVTEGNKVYSQIQSIAKSKQQAGNMAAAFWVSGQPELTLYLLSRICAEDAAQSDNLSNYAAVLSMLGGEHLAIPLLHNLQVKFRGNSTILNNLGQAWFGLGDLTKAQQYLDSAIAIYPFHPQANLTKAAIEESKGNTTKAIDCLKKSISHAYSKEKEEKLAKLGHKLTRTDLRIPFKRSADPLGLEKTHRPDYPTSIAQINALLPLWQQFNRDCDEKTEKIHQEIRKVTAKYEESVSAKATKAISMIENGGLPFISLPLYMRKASLNLQERETFYGQKMKKESERYMQMKNDEDEIRKKYLRAVPEDNCAAHRDAINALLKALNERKKKYDEEALDLYRHYCNDMAYWSQYTSVDADAFKLIVLNFQLFWLQKNRELQPLDMSVYKGAYNDCVEKEEGKRGKLADFDAIACNYKATVDFGIVVKEMNCSGTTTTWQYGDWAYIEKEQGTKYQGATIKIKPKLSAEADAGPLSVEAFVEGSFNIELDENNSVKEWEGTVNTGIETTGGIKEGPAKIEGSVKTAIEMELSSRGIEDVNMTGTAEASGKALGQKVTVGVQDKVSLISGHGSVSGTGIMKGIIISQW